jgi:hypothetical protein
MWRYIEAIVKELVAVVRAALVGWPETARLCTVLVVVAATAGIILSVLH